jgi:hypothetical protein
VTRFVPIKLANSSVALVSDTVGIFTFLTFSDFQSFAK